MRIGTRGSALALAQARSVGSLLGGVGTETELVELTTVGAASDKSRWVSELERALSDGRIDIAVHSAKDVPSELAFPLVAIPPRDDPRDAICGAGALSELGRGARVGTASAHRAAQLRAARPDLQVVELRGNVDTRLRKLADGDADAIVLALAGLRRLGRADAAGGVLQRMVPAAGQGALAVQAPPGTLSSRELEAVDDPRSHACVDAERALVAALGAGCDTPVGAWCRPLDGGDETAGGGDGDGRAVITAWVGLPDGSEWLRDELTGDPARLGAECAERLLATGAADLLERAAAASGGFVHLYGKNPPPGSGT